MISYIKVKVSKSEAFLSSEAAAAAPASTLLLLWLQRL